MKITDSQRIDRLERQLAALVTLVKMTGYNSPIERESKELTGSDLCRAMLERGDNYIMCVVGTIKEVVIIDTFQDECFYSKGVRYLNPKPINNQGEPLTASEVGL